jgi:hypothetical protein
VPRWGAISLRSGRKRGTPALGRAELAARIGRRGRILHVSTRWAMQYGPRGSTRASQGPAPFWSAPTCQGEGPRTRTEEFDHDTDVLVSFVGDLPRLLDVGLGHRAVADAARQPAFARGAAPPGNSAIAPVQLLLREMPLAGLLRDPSPLFRQCLGRLLPAAGEVGRGVVQGRDGGFDRKHAPAPVQLCAGFPALRDVRRVPMPEFGSGFRLAGFVGCHSGKTVEFLQIWRRRSRS